ncbi:MAG: hypothetical protein IJH43_05775 [Mogibacterium sp.]|nr:hypothetical protein [Mogibacterium sp.]
MKKIVCELCDSTSFVKEDGFFVCQGCGTKYSLAEAKSMMVEVEGETPQSTGTPVTPNAGIPAGNPNQMQIDNMLLLASNAYEAGNNPEAESFCNQVIALDATSYKAWFLKGKAAGWQSTVQNQRITEAAHAFAQAIDFAPEEEREDLKNQAVEELKRLGLACITLRKNRFAQFPDAQELKGFDEDRKNLLNALIVLLSKGIAAEIPQGYLEEIATLMNLAAVAGYSTASKKYYALNHPVESDWNKTRDEVYNCINLTLKAIEASKEDDKDDIIRYKNLIVYYEFLNTFKCYMNYSSYSQVGINNKGKADNNQKIANYKSKVAELEKKEEEKKAEEARKAEEERQARINAYWEENPEKKAELDAQRKELEEKVYQIPVDIAELEAQIDAKGPIEEEAASISQQIANLVAEKSKLGMFARKERDQISGEILALRQRLDSITPQIETEKAAKIPLREKKLRLNNELKEAREKLEAVIEEIEKVIE